MNLRLTQKAQSVRSKERGAVAELVQRLSREPLDVGGFLPVDRQKGLEHEQHLTPGRMGAGGVDRANRRRIRLRFRGSPEKIEEPGLVAGEIPVRSNCAVGERVEPAEERRNLAARQHALDL